MSLPAGKVGWKAYATGSTCSSRPAVRGNRRPPSSGSSRYGRPRQSLNSGRASGSRSAARRTWTSSPPCSLRTQSPLSRTGRRRTELSVAKRASASGIDSCGSTTKSVNGFMPPPSRTRHAPRISRGSASTSGSRRLKRPRTSESKSPMLRRKSTSMRVRRSACLAERISASLTMPPPGRRPDDWRADPPAPLLRRGAPAPAPTHDRNAGSRWRGGSP